MGAARFSSGLLATEPVDHLKVKCLAQRHSSSSWEGKDLSHIRHNILQENPHASATAAFHFPLVGPLKPD